MKGFRLNSVDYTHVFCVSPRNPCTYYIYSILFAPYIAHSISPKSPTSFIPFGGKLDQQNRWVKLASNIPRKILEGDYSLHFADCGMGAPHSVAASHLVAIIIKERLILTDEETVAQIRENP